MALSDDGIHWRPANFSAARQSNASCIHLPEARDSAYPSNVLFDDGDLEFSVVLDDIAWATSDKYRFVMPMTDRSVRVSTDGLCWNVWPNVTWQNATMDPGFGAFRRADGAMVGNSRPPLLRAQGRHAGLHAAENWPDLGAGWAQAVRPLDNLYRDTDQLYGLPTFRLAPGGSYLAFVWRYHTAVGRIDAELAYRYSALPARFGLPPSPGVEQRAIAQWDWTSSQP